MTTTAPSVAMISSVVHPLVRSMYMKKDFSHNDHEENVLVIETNFHQQEDNQHDNYDSYLIDLLIDLQDLKEKAEKEIGAINRVDIRPH